MTRVRLVAATVGVLASLLAVVAAGCGGGSDDASIGKGSTTTTTNETTAGADCEQVDTPEPRDPGAIDPPEENLDATVDYRLTIQTNCGDFTVALTPDLAPGATASLVSLARSGYFDDTVFHRIVPGFVIQGGDPTQTGAGGPGYTTVDPPPADARYLKGTVAMAKAGDEPPGAAGSQFFVVTADEVGLPPDYAIVGTIADADLEVVDRIGALGDETERPTEVVRVETISVVESP